MTHQTLYPFYFEPARAWVFNDTAHDLFLEPFVGDTNVLIDHLVQAAGITNAREGFKLRFSDAPFPGHQEELVYDGVETLAGLPGTWYWSNRYQMAGWLCPALLRYFPKPPAALYVAAAAMPKPNIYQAPQAGWMEGRTGVIGYDGGAAGKE